MDKEVSKFGNHAGVSAGKNRSFWRVRWSIAAAVLVGLALPVQQVQAQDMILVGAPYSVTEGEQLTIRFRLSSQPQADVYLTFVSLDTSKLRWPRPTSVTFPARQWYTNFIERFNTFHDEDVEDETVQIRIELRHGLYRNYTQTITILDDDAAFVLSKGSVTTGGRPATWTVKLKGRPSEDMTVTVTSADTNQVTVIPSSLTFTSSNWSTAQTVTAIGIPDGDNQDDVVEVSHTADGWDTGTVSVTVPEVPHMIVTPVPMEVIPEGGNKSFKVKLSERPNFTTTATMSYNKSKLQIPSNLEDKVTWQPNQWNDWRTVRVTARSDADARDDTYTMTLTTNSSDSEFDGLVRSFEIQVDDDETASLTVTPQTLLIADTDTATYTVKLGVIPSEDVVVAATSDNTGAATTSPSSLTFTRSNWNTAQTVTVSGVRDEDADIDFPIITNLASGATEYQGLSADVRVTVSETPSMVISPSPLRLNEGRTGTFTAKLSQWGLPSGITELWADISSSSSALALSHSQLTFTPGNWNTERTVTMSSQSDANAVDEVHTLTFSLSGIGFIAGGPETRTVTINDDETASVVVSKSSVTVNERDTDTWTVRLGAQPSSTVRVRVVSNNTGVATVNPPNLTYTTTNWNTAQTVTVTGATDSNNVTNSTTVTHRASGASEFASARTSVSVTTNENPVPSFVETIPDQIYKKDIQIETLQLPVSVSGNVSDDSPLVYSLEGTLPPGLTFSPSERQISGTPTQTQTETEFTYTATETIENDNGTFDSGTLTFSITVHESIRPTVEITEVPTQTNATNTTADLTFIFSEKVKDFDSSDVTAVNATATSVTPASGSDPAKDYYTVTVQPTQDGTVSVSLAADSVYDLVDNGLQPSAVVSWSHDATLPRPTFRGLPPYVNRGWEQEVTIDFGESVSGFSHSDDITGVNTLSQEGVDGDSSYTVELVPTFTDGAQFTLSILAGAVTDTHGNASVAGSTSATVDLTGPTLVSIAGVPARARKPFAATVTFSEAVDDFTADSLTLVNATASEVSGSGSARTLLIAPTVNGTYSIKIEQGAVIDLAGNPLAAIPIDVISEYSGVFDGTAPTITLSDVPAVTREPFTATFRFSEDVEGFVVGDIEVENAAEVSKIEESSGVYTAEIVPLEDGPFSVEVAAGAVSDGFGNWNETSVSAHGVYDGTAPTVTIGQVRAKASGPFPITFTFSEPVEGFAQTDVTLVDATLSNFAGSGRLYTALLTPQTDGATYSVQVLAGVAQDAAGNGNTVSTVASGVYTGASPALEISGIPAFTNLGATAVLTFSKAVTGFDASDIEVSNGSLSGFSGSGASYSVRVTPDKEGSYGLSVAEDAAQDAQGNGTLAGQASGQFDTTAPTLTVTGVPERTQGEFVATFAFSEEVVGFVADDVEVENATVSNFAGSGDRYTATVTPSGNGSFALEIATDALTDVAGNHLSAKVQESGMADVTLPSLVIAGVGPTNQAVQAVFRFSESVEGFTGSDIGVTNAVVSGFSGSGSEYTATITPSALGMFTVSVAGAAAVDAYGNGNVATTVIGTYDTTAPTVTISGVPAATNASFDATFTFSEAVTGFTPDDVVVSNLRTGHLIGQGTTWTMRMTPMAEGGFGIALGANQLTDLAGNGNTAAMDVGGTYDMTAPTVAISGVPEATNAAFSVTFTLSQADTLEATDVMVTNGTLSEFSGSGTSYTATVTPTSEGAYAVTVAADTVEDTAGNGNAAVSASGIYDTTAPSLTISLPDKVNGAVFAEFVFSEVVSGFTASDITSSNADISNLSGSGKTYQAQVSAVSAGTFSVAVAAAAVTDAAGNSNMSGSATSTYDSGARTVTLGSVPAYINQPLTVTFTFDQAVTGFTASDVVLTNATLTNFVADSNQTAYTATLVPTGEGAFTLRVPADVIDSTSGTNTPAEASGWYDPTAPQLVSIVRQSPQAQLSNASELTWRYTFSEAVTLPDDFIRVLAIQVSNLQLLASVDLRVSQVSETVWDVTALVGMAADLSDVEETRLWSFWSDNPQELPVDLAGNRMGELPDLNAGTSIFVLKTKTPSLEIKGIPSTATAAPLQVTFEFSEAVSGFGIDDITLANAQISGFTGSTSLATTYRATITPYQDGAFTVAVAADAARDAAGNGNAAATASGTYDQSAPRIMFGSDADGAVRYTRQSSNAVEVVFSEPVSFASTDITVPSGTSITDFEQLEAHRYAMKFVIAAPSSGTSYTMTIPADAVKDSQEVGNEAASLTWHYDNTPPTVTVEGWPSGTVSRSFDTTFRFSESVTGFAASDIVVGETARVSNFAGSGALYTARITPLVNASGKISLSIPAEAVEDSTGNKNALVTLSEQPYDASVSMTTTLAPSATNAFSTATFTFSEPVTGFTRDDITVTNAHVSAFSGMGADYTAVVTPVDEGEFTVAVAADVAQDESGGTNQASNTATGTYDSVAPTVTTITGVPDTARAAYAVEFSFSEAIAEFAAGNIELTNASVVRVTPKSADETTWIALVQPLAAGSFTITLPAGGVRDQAGNPNTVAATQTFTGAYEAMLPTVTITGVPSRTKEAFTATFTFAEAVRGFEAGDITTSNATLSAFAGSGTQYTATVTPQADGPFNLQIAADAARDNLGNGNPASAVVSGVYDITAPTVSITQVPAKVAGAFTAAFEFSEDVSGFVVEDITTTNATLTDFSGSGDRYTATVTPTQGGAFTVQVAQGVAQDAVGNLNAASSSAEGVLDRNAPTVAIGGMTAATNKAVAATFTFSVHR